MTLRDLIPMADARIKHDWSIASESIAATLNASKPLKNAGKFKASELNPILSKAEKRRMGNQIGSMQQFLGMIGGKGKKNGGKPKRDQGR